MAAISDYLEEKFINVSLRNTAYTPPTTVYAALFTSATTDAGGGTEVTGGTGPYARQSVTFTAPSGGATSNTADINFAGMPAATVTHVAVMDAVTAGNMLYHGALTASVAVSAGATFTIRAGDLDITLT